MVPQYEEWKIRNKWDIIADIVLVLEEGKKLKTHIGYDAHFPPYEVGKYLKLMIDKKLVKKTREDNKIYYKLKRKGRKFHSAYRKFKKILEGEVPIILKGNEILLEKIPKVPGKQDRYDITAKILRIGMEKTLKTKIMNKAKLSFAQLGRYLNFLLEMVFLEQMKTEYEVTIFKTTEIGMKLLERYVYMHESLYGNSG